MNTPTPEHEDAHGRDAMVHTLLQEELGRGVDVTGIAGNERVLARFAAGEGAAAAVRLTGAEQQARATWLQHHWPLLCAALALIAVGATFAHTWLDSSDRSGGGLEPPTAPIQEPIPTPRPAPEGEVINVGDFNTLRSLRFVIERIDLEVLRLHDASLPFELDVSGYLVTATDEMRKDLLDDLVVATERVEPAGAIWQNRLTLHLPNDKRIEMAIDVNGPATGRVRLHTRGMDGDLLVGEQGSRTLRDLLDSATYIARLQNGIVRSAQDLIDYESYDAVFERLQLFGLRERDLPRLAGFPELLELDASGLRGVLTVAGLRHIGAACPDLQVLLLNGIDLSGGGAGTLAPVLQLRKLEQLHLDACPGLDDVTLAAIAEAGRQLHKISLRNNRQITDGGVRRLAAIPQLHEVDLRGCDAIRDEQIVDLRRRQPGMRFVR